MSHIRHRRELVASVQITLSLVLLLFLMISPGDGICSLKRTYLGVGDPDLELVASNRVDESVVELSIVSNVAFRQRNPDS